MRLHVVQVWVAQTTNPQRQPRAAVSHLQPRREPTPGGQPLDAPGSPPSIGNGGVIP